MIKMKIINNERKLLLGDRQISLVLLICKTFVSSGIMYEPSSYNWGIEIILIIIWFVNIMLSILDEYRNFLKLVKIFIAHRIVGHIKVL